MRRLRLALAPVLMIALAVIGGVSALADSGTTQISVTVPSSISLTGLAATYTGSIPAGTTGNIDTGPVTVSTNNASGYTLSVSATTPDFNSTNGYAFAISADTLSSCDSSFSSCVSKGALTQSGTVVKSSANPTSGDSIGVRQSISIAGNQPGAVYTVNETFTATANP